MEDIFSPITSNPLYEVLARYHIHAVNQLHDKELRQSWLNSSLAEANYQAAIGGFSDGLKSVCASLQLSLEDTRPPKYLHATSYGTAIEPKAEGINLPYKRTFLAQYIYKCEGYFCDRQVKYMQGTLLGTRKVFGIEFMPLRSSTLYSRKTALFEIELPSRTDGPLLMVHKSYELPKRDRLRPHDYKVDYLLKTSDSEKYHYRGYCRDSNAEYGTSKIYAKLSELLERYQCVDVIWLDENSLTLHVRSEPGTFPIYMPTLFSFAKEAIELM